MLLLALVNFKTMIYNYILYCINYGECIMLLLNISLNISVLHSCLHFLQYKKKHPSGHYIWSQQVVTTNVRSVRAKTASLCDVFVI